MHRGAAELEDTGVTPEPAYTGVLQNQHTQGYSRTRRHRGTPEPAYTGVLQNQHTQGYSRNGKW